VSIKIKVRGPGNVEREVQYDDGIDASEFLLCCLKAGDGKINWSLDYSYATENEKIEWGRADMRVRVIIALASGRTVRFIDPLDVREWQSTDEKDVHQTANEIFEVIASSGMMVAIKSDNEHDITIVSGNPEHKLQ
jgi:hypothetical protein